MMDGIYLVGAVALGWLLSNLSSYFESRRGNKALQSVQQSFELGLTGGDGAKLYNLRVADAVSKQPATIKAATKSEVSRHEPEVFTQTPWSHDPLYNRCEINIDDAAGVVYVFDPDGADGPDTWTEDLGPFMARWETR